MVRAAGPTSHVDIRISQGVYRDAGTLNWNVYVPGRRVSFMPLDYRDGAGIDDIAGRPVFRGPAGGGVCWLWARLPDGDPGGDKQLRVYYLQVERYAECGLRLHGGFTTGTAIARPASNGLNNNLVYGMVFRELGTRHVSGTERVGYAGVQLFNSRNNRIVNSHFVQLENRTSAQCPQGPQLIHGVYMLHYSNDNVVTRNNFRTISGNAIHARNHSDDNRMYENGCP